jgi:hypothetical protein
MNETSLLAEKGDLHQVDRDRKEKKGKGVKEGPKKRERRTTRKI